jgi:Asp-tRNA(Asn)/Glu-tRNA(Gln) amidotransferase B subunit
MIGDFLMRFRQIAARLTEFKAVMSTRREEKCRKEIKNQEPFKTIENALKLMKNLKILELDGDPYWTERMVENETGLWMDVTYTTQPYRLDQIPSI